jgi:hypothetical protein
VGRYTYTHTYAYRVRSQTPDTSICRCNMHA